MARAALWLCLLMIPFLAACSTSGSGGDLGYGSDLDVTGGDTCAIWSPDGRLIAFSEADYTVHGAAGEVFVAKSDGSRTHRVRGTRPSDSLLAWLGSNALVVVRKQRLIAVDLNSGRSRRLSRRLPGEVLSLSPDGRYVLVSQEIGRASCRERV